MSLVLLMDASSSVTDRMPLAQAATKRFVAALRPDDEVRVVAFNDRVSVLQELTVRSRRRWARAIDAIAAGGATALYNALYATFRNLPPAEAGGRLRRRVIVLALRRRGHRVPGLGGAGARAGPPARGHRPRRSPCARRATPRTAPRACSGLLSGESGGRSPSPRFDPRPRLRLRADRRRAAQPVHRRLRLLQPGPGRRMAPHRAARPREEGPSGPPSHGLLCRTVMALAASPSRCPPPPPVIDHVPLEVRPLRPLHADHRDRARGGNRRRAAPVPGRGRRLVLRRHDRRGRGTEWSAVLPRPVRPLARLDYRIVMRTSDATETSTPPVSARVGDDTECGRPGRSSPDVAAPIVVQVPKGAPLVPPFRPASVPPASWRPKPPSGRRG